MIKNAFYYIIIVGLCFGQSRGLKNYPRVSLMLSRSIYTKPLDKETDRKAFVIHSIHNPPSLNYNHSTTLMLQIEGDTTSVRTTAWKQMGIYGLEFLGAGCGSVMSGFFAYLSSDMPASGPEGWTFYCSYIASNMLLTSTCIWGVGKLMKQKGHWWRASIGAGLGTLIGVFVVPSITGWNAEEGDWQWHVLYFTTPALGSLIGFNL